MCMTKLSRSEFFAAIIPIVMLIRQQGSPILPSVRLAQSLLETGGVIHAWNNLGGVKVGSGKLTPYWRGEAVTKDTWEFRSGQEVTEKAAFRAYRTLYHYYKDQDMLLLSSRYQKVRTATTAQEQTQQLKAAGYATDPAYANKLMSIINQYSLDIYDSVNPQPILPKLFEKASLVPIYASQQYITAAYYLNYTNYVPVRKFAEYFGAMVMWSNKQVYINGEKIDTILVDGTSYAVARELASRLELSLEWDSYAKVLFVY